jgi:hypothetical protein
MSILNYTTKINESQTINEIQSLLIDHGATNISIDYKEKFPVALTFSISFGDGYLNFRLPSKWEGVYKVMIDSINIPKKYKTEEQARKVAWRITKDWVESQIAIIQAELAVLPEVFLPYAITDSGKTVYESVADKGLKFLSSSKN